MLHLFFKMEPYVGKFYLYLSPTLSSSSWELLLINEKCSSDCMGDRKKILRSVMLINS